MRWKRVNSKAKIHWGKGNRDFSKNEFRAYCSDSRMIENGANSLTYSLDEITCKTCLEKFIEVKNKEINKATEYLKYAN